MAQQIFPMKALQGLKRRAWQVLERFVRITDVKSVVKPGNQQVGTFHYVFIEVLGLIEQERRGQLLFDCF
ncbi:MAG: hypothetical protein D6B25_17515 [Desulfobulbaceae bacterium]|nr:MAG: hypothetical protein D6B25_17515 [Desulfobulbaceae bacterium]